MHLSFVRSSTLDSWAGEQLRLMAAGGNQRARTFFKQHGWEEVGADKIEAKYTSRAAQLYRRQLERDASRLGADGEAPPAPGAPAAGPAAPAGAPRPAPAAGKLAARVGAPRRAGARGAGLGVRKAAAAVDESLFDQAPAEEAPAPAAAPLGADGFEAFEDAGGAPAPSSRFNLDAMEERARPAPARGADGHLSLSVGGAAGAIGDDFFAGGAAPGGRRESVESPLAFGGGGAGFGGRPAPPRAGRNGGAAPPAPGGAAAADSGAAQQRFGNAKSISSSAYHGGDSKESDYERQARMSQFQGSAAISSDAYFGRAGPGGGGGGGSSLDAAAADLVSRVSLTAREDARQLGALAAEAGSKLSQLAQGFLRDLQGGY